MCSGTLKVSGLPIHSSLTASLSPVLLNSTLPARHMASTDLHKEAVVSSFIGDHLLSSCFLCSLSVRTANIFFFFYVRHSLWDRNTMQTSRTSLFWAVLGHLPLWHAAVVRGKNRARRENRSSILLPGAWICVLLTISTRLMAERSLAERPQSMVHGKFHSCRYWALIKIKRDEG